MPSTARTVGIFHRGQRVGAPSAPLPVTQARHGARPYAQLPPALRRLGPQDQGPNTEGLISAVLASRPHPEQGFRTCLGILRFYRGLDRVRVEAVSARAVELRRREAETPLRVICSLIPALDQLNALGLYGLAKLGEELEHKTESPRPKMQLPKGSVCCSNTS